MAKSVGQIVNERREFLVSEEKKKLFKIIAIAFGPYTPDYTYLARKAVEKYGKKYKGDIFIEGIQGFLNSSCRDLTLTKQFEITANHDKRSSCKTKLEQAFEFAEKLQEEYDKLP